MKDSDSIEKQSICIRRLKRMNKFSGETKSGVVAAVLAAVAVATVPNTELRLGLKHADGLHLHMRRLQADGGGGGDAAGGGGDDAGGGASPPSPSAAGAAGGGGDDAAGIRFGVLRDRNKASAAYRRRLIEEATAAAGYRREPELTRLLEEEATKLAEEEEWGDATRLLRLAEQLEWAPMRCGGTPPPSPSAAAGPSGSAAAGAGGDLRVHIGTDRELKVPPHMTVAEFLGRVNSETPSRPDTVWRVTADPGSSPNAPYCDERGKLRDVDFAGRPSIRTGNTRQYGIPRYGLREVVDRPYLDWRDNGEEEYSRLEKLDDKTRLEWKHITLGSS